jgi:heme A synthase
VNRLIFIPTQNRWFFHLAWLTSLLAFIIIIHPNRILTGILGALILILTFAAASCHRHFTYRPFLICLALIALLTSQVLVKSFASARLLPIAADLLQLSFGLTLLSLLWWLSMVTRPDSYFLGHSSLKRIRPWAWLALFVVVLQITTGGWLNPNNTAYLTHDLPPLLHHTTTLIFAGYIGLFSFLLLFNPYLRHVALFILALLTAQLISNNLALSLRPLVAAIGHNAMIALLLLTIVTLLINLHRKSQDYWLGAL